MNKHKSNKIKENSNTVRHLIMEQITTTQNLVAIKEVRHAGQSIPLRLPENDSVAPKLIISKLYEYVNR